MEDEESKMTKKNLEKSTIEPKANSIEDAEKDRIEHVISSTKELINNNNSEKVLDELVKDIGHGDKSSAEARLAEIKKRNKCDWLKTYQNPDQEGETLLHLAVKSQDDISLVTKLSDICPDLLLRAREHSLKFRGQTALHMAITKCNEAAIEAMLKACRKHKNEEMSTLLQTRATGFRFVNTVMMGQIPLTVAALTGNIKIVDALIRYGADLYIQNDEEDTVFHSLVKYAATYPEKVMTIIQMMRHLNYKLGEKNQIDKIMFDKFGTDKQRHTYSFLWFV